MRKSLQIQLGQAVFSWQMITTTFVGVLILIWYSVTNWIQLNSFLGNISYSEVCGDFLDAIYNAHARTGFSLFAPVFAVAHSSTKFCDDYNSGYIKSILLRTSVSSYIKDRVIVCSIVGGLAVFLPELICSVIFLSVGELHSSGTHSSFLDSSVFSEIQYVGGGLLVAVLFLFFTFLFGIVWSNIGLCISAYLPNKYIALSAPFAIYYGLHLLLNRTATFAMYSPANMVQPTSKLLPNILFPIIYQLSLLLLSTVLFTKKLKQRLLDI